MYLLCVVDPEEVRVQDRLYDAGHDRDRVEMSLCEISIDPIGNVQGSVNAQSKQVMCCDGFGFTSSLEHKQLRQDGNAFQPYRERPEHLGKSPFVWE